MDEESVGSEELPVFSDIRRYYCQYCGICRSKKTLITSHINLHHKDMEDAKDEKDNDGGDGLKSNNTCEECGASFKKHAYLLQHMQSHLVEHWIPEKELQNARGRMIGLDGSVSGRETSCEAPSRMPQSRSVQNERPYVCTFDNCQASYRRKDHLTRHLAQHEGKTFKCPIQNCNLLFSLQSNMKRHVKEMHNESSTSTSAEGQKQYVCPEVGCGKVFKYASKLRKHEDSHVKLESVEVLCLEPGCMKHFTNPKCLKEHINSCHLYTTCDICGTEQLKKNMKRHLRMHEADNSSEVFKCVQKDCDCSFSSKSNLHKHEKAVHFKDKPYVCGFSDCGMRFAYKHVRDKHEKTGKHVFTLGDFEEADAEFRSRPRGGRKRVCPSVEMLVRKRITPPSQLDNWLLMQDSD
ncbi:PREDICTED: transcription factor IIIA isoform X1 [Lupinus angustifolius]|uniref:transcription factor IIIA isoform X1 n=1 Tax=Lupinus angustifolius TaxID=3871 RepID=UPI00092E9A74|nr:PREDICTED: transcription factor IIIA isoform X1 [Lupinus angustifolius]